MRPSWAAPLLVLTAATVASGRVPAAELKLGDEKTFLKFGLLLQPWVAFEEDAAPDGESLANDYYLRRLRLLFSGQLSEKINYFVETDTPNFGKRGDFSARTFIQDAWVEFNLHPAAQIDAGMLLVPFSHNGMQGATTLHTLDYHSSMLRYPSGSNVVWRDFGLMVRGLLLDQVLEYRLAVLNGIFGSRSDPRNPHDWPRVAARLTCNLFEADGQPGVSGFFYDGLYLVKTDDGTISPRKMLSLGVSADWQKDLNVSLDEQSAVTGRTDYIAVSGDLFWDLPLDGEKKIGFAGQVDFFYYDHGERQTSFYLSDSKYSSEYTGYGLLAEAGLRYDAFELVVGLDWYEATEADGDQGDLLSVVGGINFWWFAHNCSLKAQAGGSKLSGGPWGMLALLQVQLLL